MMRTTLESGAWIEHVPIQDLKGKHKRAYDRAGKPPVPPEAVDEDGGVDVRAIVTGMDVMSFGAARQDALWLMLIDSWSWDLPVTADSLGELPLDDYDEIGLLFAPFEKKLNRRADPKGAIISASNGLSPARAGGSRRG
jgi:hypothetical protein